MRAFTLQSFFLLSLSLYGLAQQPPDMLTGEFFLRGVPEMASGFRFNADSTFDFFYIYGAVDRFGKGTFEYSGDSLILHSQPKPERDFILQTQKTTPDQRVLIHISDPNPMVLPYILCQIETPDTVLQGQSDQDGNIVFPQTTVRSIALLHQFFAERASTFPIESPESNYFEFSIDPRIAEVDFNGIVLHIEGKNLKGKHPLLDPGQTFRFEGRE